MDENKYAWDSKLPLVVLVGMVTVKKAIGLAPFDLVYGIPARLPKNNLMSLYKFIQKYDEDLVDDMQERVDELMGLNEYRKKHQKGLLNCN